MLRFGARLVAVLDAGIADDQLVIDRVGVADREPDRRPPSDIEVGERPVRVVGGDPDGLHGAGRAAVGVGPAARGQTDTEQTGDDDRPYLHAAADFEPLAAFTAKMSSEGTTRQAAITS